MSRKDKLYFLGDCFFRTKNNSNPFAIINNQLEDAYVLSNFETSLYESFTENTSKLVQLGISIEEIPSGAIDNIDCFNLANNHTFDFGEKSLLYTISFLKENNKQIIGIRDYEFVITEINGKSIGFVSCVAYSGIKRNIYIDHKDALEIIKSTRNKCDYIILSIHWGTEYANFPSPSQRKMAKQFIHEGVDLLIGHHPHVMQGYEMIDGKYVFYSLGNCNFRINKQWLSEWTDISMIVRIEDSRINSAICEFYKIDENYCLNYLDSKEKKGAEEHLCSISNQNLQLGWMKWGIEISPVFIRQEMNAFKKRFKRKELRQYMIFCYWLTRPKTLFMIFSYTIHSIVKRKKNAKSI